MGPKNLCFFGSGLFDRLFRIGPPEAVLFDIAVKALAGHAAPETVAAFQTAHHIGGQLRDNRGLLIGFGLQGHAALFHPGRDQSGAAAR